MSAPAALLSSHRFVALAVIPLLLHFASEINLSYHLFMPKADTADLPKYQQVYRALHSGIQAGRWKEGDRLPSEAELVRQFGASRITVGRAVRDLQQAGIVERRAGSGTFVRAARPRAA